jgi:hypothetical protein
MNMMATATATEDQLTAFGERPVTDVSYVEPNDPLDLGLLLTMNSHMHCRTPMERIDPAELPVRQPVYVDGTGGVPIGMSAVSEGVVTYRCACGFTIDDPASSPAITPQALAS